MSGTNLSRSGSGLKPVRGRRGPPGRLPNLDEVHPLRSAEPRGNLQSRFCHEAREGRFFGGFTFRQLGQKHSKSSLSGRAKWPHLLQKNLLPSTWLIMRLKSSSRTQYGHRTIFSTIAVSAGKDDAPSRSHPRKTRSVERQADAPGMSEAYSRGLRAAIQNPELANICSWS